jgi:hypothetical protein
LLQSINRSLAALERSALYERIRVAAGVQYP